MDKATDLLPTTIEGALDATPIALIAKVIEPLKVEAFIAYHLTKLAAQVNVDQRLNIQPHQVPYIAQALMENFAYESLADINLCFKRGAMGFYGEIFRLDAAVIVSWMQSYLDEKYDALEQRKAKEKYTERADRQKEAVDGSKYINQMLENLGAPTKETGPREETEYQRYKLKSDYVPPTDDQVEAKKARIRELQEIALREKYPGLPDEEIKRILNDIKP